MKELLKWDESIQRFIEPDECSWETVEEWIAIGLCNMCGCGNDQVKADVIETFKAVAEKTLKIDREDKYQELILNVLTGANLLEHGTVVNHSWLTEQGGAVYGLLKNYPSTVFKEEEK